MGEGATGEAGGGAGGGAQGASAGSNAKPPKPGRGVPCTDWRDYECKNQAEQGREKALAHLFDSGLLRSATTALHSPSNVLSLTHFPYLSLSLSRCLIVSLPLSLYIPLLPCIFHLASLTLPTTSTSLPSHLGPTLPPLPTNSSLPKATTKLIQHKLNHYLPLPLPLPTHLHSRRHTPDNTSDKRSWFPPSVMGTSTWKQSTCCAAVSRK